MINTHLHSVEAGVVGGTVDMGAEQSPEQSLCSFKDHIHTAIQPHLLSVKPFSKKSTKKRLHNHGENSNTQPHRATFFPGQCGCGDWWRYLLKAKKKRGVSRKQQLVYYKLTCNSSGGTVREGLVPPTPSELRLDVCAELYSGMWYCVHVSRCDGMGGERLPTVHQG